MIGIRTGQGDLIAAIIAIIFAGTLAMAAPHNDPSEYWRLRFYGGTLLLPGDLKQTKAYRDELFVGRTIDGKIQVTISVYTLSFDGAGYTPTELFKQLLARDLYASKAAAPPNTHMSPPVIDMVDDNTISARYSGQTEDTRSFATDIVLHEDLFITIFVEALGERQSELADISSRIFDSIAFDRAKRQD